MKINIIVRKTQHHNNYIIKGLFAAIQKTDS